jgi:putative heme-binding domain-containing protein
MQVALSLGESRSKQATASLVELAVRHGDDPWISAAVLSATTDTADEVLEAILASELQPNHGVALLPAVASIIGARRDAQQLGRTLSAIGRLSARQAARQRECLRGLVEGLEQGRATPVGNENITHGLRSLLADQDPQLRRLALQVASLLRLQQLPEMRVIFAEASRVALDKNAPAPLRCQSVALLAAAPWETLQSVAEELLDPRQPVEIQLAMVEAVGGVDHPDTEGLLLGEFSRFTPKLQSAVIHTMLAREDRLSTLLAAIEDGRVPRAGIDATRRLQLLNHPRQEIAAKAQQLLSSTGGTADRQDVLAEYKVALRMPRDLERGKKIFEQQCNKCHRLGDQGFEVGPDMLTAKTRADETLLLDVLDPSNQITVGYNQYTVITEDGRIFSGVLAAETATSITLREEEKKETVILRKDIDEMVASPLSMMPQDVEKEVTPQDLADLLGFLRQTLGSAQPETVVLFDDDAEFVQLLTEGDGHARLESSDCHAGEVALAVSPPQRFSAHIPGWEYQITEDPEPGQFRYLRFAWKQPAGDGVMLELAASGSWPAATDSRQRYYSGHNTTGWQAVRVSDETPAQWTVVTRDLWKDFGSFTLTGIAPTAMNGEALFDRIELLRSLEPTVINTEQR